MRHPRDNGMKLKEIKSKKGKVLTQQMVMESDSLKQNEVNKINDEMVFY